MHCPCLQWMGAVPTLHIKALISAGCVFAAGGRSGSWWWWRIRRAATAACRGRSRRGSSWTSQPSSWRRTTRLSSSRWLWLQKLRGPIKHMAIVSFLHSDCVCVFDSRWSAYAAKVCLGITLRPAQLPWTPPTTTSDHLWRDCPPSVSPLRGWKHTNEYTHTHTSSPLIFLCLSSVVPAVCASQFPPLFPSEVSFAKLI